MIAGRDLSEVKETSQLSLVLLTYITVVMVTIVQGGEVGAHLMTGTVSVTQEQNDVFLLMLLCLGALIP